MYIQLDSFVDLPLHERHSLNGKPF